LGASGRDVLFDDAAAVAAQESSSARVKTTDELVLVLVSEEDMPVEDGLAEIRRMEGIGEELDMT
jgi:hypothetical protein